MKHCYSILLFIFMTVASLNTAAQDITFTIDFNDPEAVTVTKDYTENIEIVAGVNTFTVPPRSSMQIIVNKGFAFESITDKAGTPQQYYDGAWYLSIWDQSVQGEAFTVKTVNLGASRTASFTLEVDNASMVSAVFSGTSLRPTLQNGTQVISFDPEIESTLYLSAIGAQKLYSVTLDGEPVSIEETVAIPLEDGCIVNVKAQFPQKPVTVTIDFDESLTPGLVTDVSINYTTLAGFNGKTFTADSGDYVDLYFNTAKYKVDEILINGVPYDLQYFYDAISFTPVEDAVVAVKAHPWGTIDVIVNIENPDDIILYAGFMQPENIVKLAAGRNEVKVPEDAPALSWSATNGSEIVSVTSDLAGEINGTSITATPGLQLTFITRKITLGQTFVFWVDDRTAAEYYFRLRNAKREDYPVVNGYNVIDFTDSYNPYELSFVGAPFGALYINGEEMAPTFEGGTYWEINVAEGDVIKCFCKKKPVMCNTSFNVTGEGDATFTYDIIKTFDNWREGFECFSGTQVIIAPAQDVTNATCSVNGTEITPDESGAFMFTVNSADTKVDLNLKKGDGISSITTDYGTATDAPIYNLQGIKIETSVSELPAGIYIRGGKKILVK
ncbi:MAG: hypothetical protein NC405_01280 [Odoribacter sp.]|nr:hypothetical protein [Odoribacter sp.]